ncbi:hypothetical protein CJ030_MR1G005384 [Morella rubra]|uniref:Uncharacterized protein n=1 Tax=Morella rubra TaxID=262757 RepID=A0A6A1WMM2_9ROSI|nr:hypothetical protein CJ030_MR1G005384 [Morella rubra]
MSRIESQNWIMDVSQVREPAQWPECCIYRVPKKFLKVNKDAYTPKLISIGPLHHGSEELRDMEELKVRYFKLYFVRALKGEDGASTAEEKKVILWKKLERIVEENSEKICRCYAERPQLGQTEFVRMILVDATFIIELFLRAFEDVEDGYDYILSKPWLRHDIKQDLILLENQLPFFILEKIHERFSIPVKKERTDFLTLAGNYFSQSFVYQERSFLTEVKHLTDLLRYLFCPPNRKFDKFILNGSSERDTAAAAECLNKLDKAGLNVERTFNNLPSASKLDGAGVEFQRVEGDLFDIEFKKGKSLERIPCLNCSWLLACLPCFKCFPFLVRMQPFLELPHFVVDDSTETVFRNLMSLEQCHYPLEAYICNYMVLLDALINTEKDVDLLISKKIIVNQLGSTDAVTTMINKLCEEIGEVNSYYYPLSKQLSNHYDNFWNHAMATLTRVYFTNIWKGTATVVGLIVLGFTIWGFIKK